jgi:hypothetical protein
MSILKVPSTQVLLSGRSRFSGGKAGSSRRGHENSGNIPVDIGAITVSAIANSVGSHTLSAGEAEVGAYQFSLPSASGATITNQTITITAAANEVFGRANSQGGIVVEHVSTLGTETATMNGSNVLTNFPGYGSVAFNPACTEMTYQRLKGVTANESLSAVNVYIRLGTQTISVAD